MTKAIEIGIVDQKNQKFGQCMRMKPNIETTIGCYKENKQIGPGVIK